MNTIIKNEDGTFWVRCFGIYVGTFSTKEEANRQGDRIHLQLKPKQMSEAIKPSHYNDNEAYDVYSFAIKNNLGMLEGNVIKYVSRHDKKNGKEDLLKAIETLERLIREKY